MNKINRIGGKKIVIYAKKDIVHSMKNTIKYEITLDFFYKQFVY